MPSRLSRRLWAIALSVAFSWIVVAAADDASDAEKADAIAKINAKLEREITIDVIKTPLDKHCRELEKLFRIKITLDPEGLRKAGVAKDRPVTLLVKGVTVRTSLQKLLDPLGLTFEVRPDGLLITAKARPAK